MSARPHVGGTAEGVTDTAVLRDVLGRFTTGVTVITCMAAHGPVGMTANSFASVSLDPPLVLFSVSRRSQLCSHLTETDCFAVNILNADQQDLSKQFARPGLHRFGDRRWKRGVTGSPVLPDVLAVLECRVADVHAGGDHSITLGRVIEAYSDTSATAPLVFFRGGYRRISTD